MLRSLFVLVFFLLAGCAEQAPSAWQQHSYFNFSKVHNYQLLNRSAKFIDIANLPASEQALIELTLEQSLTQLGLKLSDNNADVMLSYFVVQQQTQFHIKEAQKQQRNGIKQPALDQLRQSELNQDLQSYNQLVHFCWQCISANERNKLSEDNTLILDFIDPRTHNSIWRSSKTLNWKADDNSQQRQTKLMEALSAMLSKYPTK